MILEEEILQPCCLLWSELHLQRLKKSVLSFGVIITFQEAKAWFLPASKFARIYVYEKKIKRSLNFKISDLAHVFLQCAMWVCKLVGARMERAMIHLGIYISNKIWRFCLGYQHLAMWRYVSLPPSPLLISFSKTNPKLQKMFFFSNPH